MCMGYAKDIKAWACPQEIGRREQLLRLWGDLMREGPEPFADDAGSSRSGLIQSLDDQAQSSEAS